MNERDCTGAIRLLPDQEWAKSLMNETGFHRCNSGGEEGV